MASKSENNTNKWTHPDELIKLQCAKLRSKKLEARLCQNKGPSEKDNKSLLENTQKRRKNPFTRQVKRARTEITQQDNFTINLLNTQIFSDQPALQEPFVYGHGTTKPPETANFVYHPFDPQAFRKLLNGGQETEAENEAVEIQKLSKHLPMDWALKSRVRFFCTTELPATTLKTNQMASGLTSFVRCVDILTSSSGLDISPATRFNQATYYWQHPHIPWMKLFPRNSKENIGITLGERERKALAEEWDYSFRGLFQLLRSRQCPYFYLCTNTFTVLFRAAGTGGRVETHALMSPSTRGMRSALRQEGVEYTMPLKKNEACLNKSGESSFSGESKDLHDVNIINEESDDDDDTEGAWLQNLEVDEKEIRRMQSAHLRKIKAEEMSEDFSDNSMLLIEGIECQGFFSFLLNAKSTITSVGRLAGVPPTLLAPVAFPKATMQHLSTRSSKVRMDGIDYNSIEVKGIILPTFLPHICHLLAETKKTFSATLASCNNTLAFSKATKKLLETKYELTEAEDQAKDAITGCVFGQENLSDCGLLPCVIENMCRTDINAVGLVERVCYDSQHGYAWS